MNRSFWIAVLCLILILWISETTHLDLWVQDFFYQRQTATWWIWKDDPLLQLIFYSGVKIVFVLVGCGLLIGWLLAWRKKFFIQYQKPFSLLLLALILIPSLISTLKNITNVHCPWSIQRYGGGVPYVGVFDSYPIEFKSERPGKCFPAGHPSGGFAFMMLFYSFNSRKARLYGLLFGLSLGWTLGLYQMFKGAHYVSHVMVSMLLAWILIECIQTTLSIYFTNKFTIPPGQTGGN